MATDFVRTSRHSFLNNVRPSSNTYLSPTRTVLSGFMVQTIRYSSTLFLVVYNYIIIHKHHEYLKSAIQTPISQCLAHKLPFTVFRISYGTYGTSY
jgi:hypothetical protein